MASFQNSKTTLLPLSTLILFFSLTFLNISNGLTALPGLTELPRFDLPAVEKKTRLSFVFSENIAGAPDANDFIVAGPNMTFYAKTDITVYDDPMRETDDITSAYLGRVQGLIAYTTEDLSSVSVENILFTAGQYNGSTLVIVGWIPNITEWVERPVVGGTGYFRMARGSAFTKILSISETTYVVKFDVHVLHY